MISNNFFLILNRYTCIYMIPNNMEILRALMISMVCIIAGDCYNINIYRNYWNRPTYTYYDVIDPIYSLPGKNITTVCSNVNNHTSSWYKMRYAVGSQWNNNSLEVYRVYTDYDPNVEKIYVNESQEMILSSVSRRKHDNTYVCVDEETMEVQRTIMINIFDSPFINYDVQKYNIKDYNVLECGIDINDHNLEYYRWMYFPIDDNVKIYEFISMDQRVLSGNEFKYILDGCNLRLIYNNVGLYVFRATFHRGWYKDYHVRSYKLVM